MKKEEKKKNETFGDIINLEDFKMPDENVNEPAATIPTTKVI